MNAAKQEKSLMRRLALPMAGGALSGLAATFLFLILTDLDPQGLGSSREIAGIVAILYVVIAIGIGVGVASPRIGARFLNVEDAEEVREQRRMLGYSGVAMAVLGGALFLLAFTEPVGSIKGEIAAPIAVALVLLACILGHIQARHVDELQRAMSRDSAATALYLMFFT